MPVLSMCPFVPTLIEIAVSLIFEESAGVLRVLSCVFFAYYSFLLILLEVVASVSLLISAPSPAAMIPLVVDGSDGIGADVDFCSLDINKKSEIIVGEELVVSHTSSSGFSPQFSYSGVINRNSNQFTPKILLKSL